LEYIGWNAGSGCCWRLIYFTVPGDDISAAGVVAASSAGGGEGVLFLPEGLAFKAFLRRCKQKRMSPRIIMRAARPPTTPPAMAPTFVLPDLLSEGVPVPVGITRVAERALKEAWRVKKTPSWALFQAEGLVIEAPPVGLKDVRRSSHDESR